MQCSVCFHAIKSLSKQCLLVITPICYLCAFQALVDRTKNCDDLTIVWVIEGLIDGFRMGYIDIGQFVIAKLKDVKRSYVEVLLMKLRVKNLLINTWLPTLSNAPIEIREKIKSLFMTFDSVRKGWACFPESMDDPDMSFSVGWPPHANQLAQFCDDIVYSDIFDGRFKDDCFACL